MNNINEVLVKFDGLEYKYVLKDDSLNRLDYAGNSQLIQSNVILYDVAVDVKGTHHIIVVLNSGVFSYQKEEINCWKVRHLEKFPINVNKIENININCFDDKVHILYDFTIYGKNTRNYNYKSFIIHVFNKGTLWKKSNISTFTQSKPPKYHYTILEDGDLFYFKVISSAKFTTLTPYRFSARKMTWSRKKDVKLNKDIGKLNIILNKNDIIHFFFNNEHLKMLNYFNININFTDSINPEVVHSDEEIKLRSAVIENGLIKLLASYPDNNEKAIIFEQSESTPPWEKKEYELNIDDLKYICNDLKLNTFRGSDEHQNILLLIDEYQEFVEEEIIIFNEEIEELTESDDIILVEESEDSKEVILAPLEENVDSSINELIDENKDDDIVELTRSGRIKLQIDNIFKRIANYMTQND